MGFRKTPELSLAATGSVVFGRNRLNSTGGWCATARSHILTDFLDTRAQGVTCASDMAQHRLREKNQLEPNSSARRHVRPSRSRNHNFEILAWDDEANVATPIRSFQEIENVGFQRSRLLRIKRRECTVDRTVVTAKNVKPTLR
jgi:hypothetical protein